MGLAWGAVLAELPKRLRTQENRPESGRALWLSAAAGLVPGEGALPLAVLAALLPGSAALPVPLLIVPPVKRPRPRRFRAGGGNY